MNRKKNQLLAFPYIFWMAGFTIIPLLMMLYYGLTNRRALLLWKISWPLALRSI